MRSAATAYRFCREELPRRAARTLSRSWNFVRSRSDGIGIALALIGIALAVAFYVFPRTSDEVVVTEELRVDASAWLTTGIDLESAFHCFDSQVTDRPGALACTDGSPGFGGPHEMDLDGPNGEPLTLWNLNYFDPCLAIDMTSVVCELGEGELGKASLAGNLDAEPLSSIEVDDLPWRIELPSGEYCHPSPGTPTLYLCVNRPQLGVNVVTPVGSDWFTGLVTGVEEIRPEYSRVLPSVDGLERVGDQWRGFYSNALDSAGVERRQVVLTRVWF